LRACFAICAQREMKKNHYTHWYQVSALNYFYLVVVMDLHKGNILCGNLIIEI